MLTLYRCHTLKSLVHDICTRRLAKKLARRTSFTCASFFYMCQFLSSNKTQLDVKSSLHTFPLTSPKTRKLRTCCGNVGAPIWRTKSATSWQQVVVMEFGKLHDTADTTDLCPRQLTDLSFMLRTCCGLATGKLV